MKFEGTPGPWTGKDIGICQQDKAGLQLGFIMSSDEKRVAECAANAHLIAAAPDLLQALQQMVERIEYYANLDDADKPSIEDWAYTYNSSDMDEARAAIAKAIGKEE